MKHTMGSMESPWILILETACGDEAECVDKDESSNTTNQNHDKDFSSGASAYNYTLELWKNHSSSAILQCDIAFFPVDLTLSREEFLDSIWRLPNQLLHPCGNENLLLFPPMNVSEYQITISSCLMQTTPIFSESLPVDAMLPTDTRVMWPSLSPDGNQDVVVTRVQVSMNLTETATAFHRWTDLWEETALDTNLLSVFDDADMPYNFENKTEVLVLLQSLKAKIESDAQAVDRIMAVMALVFVALLFCQIKFMFVDTPQQRRNERHSTPKQHPSGRHVKSSWLLPGLASFSSPLATPRWTKPDTINDTTARRPPLPIESDSPNVALDTWMRNKEERRRNRRQVVDMVPRRIITPSTHNTPPREEESPAATIKMENNAVSWVKPLTSLGADEKKSPTSCVRSTKATPKQEKPEQLARSLWGFGI